MAKGSSVTGTKSVQDAKKQLQRFLKTLDTVPAQILEDESKQLYAEIISEVPYKTGKLERSVKVSVSKDKRRPGLNASASARSEQGYNYAGRQHEDTSLQHPIKGKAHFISDPFNRATQRIVQRMTDELDPRRTK